MAIGLLETLHQRCPVANGEHALNVKMEKAAVKWLSTSKRWWLAKPWWQVGCGSKDVFGSQW